jgi:hypothetical protein
MVVVASSDSQRLPVPQLLVAALLELTRCIALTLAYRGGHRTNDYGIRLETHFGDSYNLRNTRDTLYIASRAASTILGVLYTSQISSSPVLLVWEMIGRYRLLHHLAHEPAQGITASTHNARDGVTPDPPMQHQKFNAL